MLIEAKDMMNVAYNGAMVETNYNTQAPSNFGKLRQGKAETKPKNILLALVFFLLIVLLILATLVYLQPSPQEAALSNLSAVDDLLKQIKLSESEKLDDALKGLKKLKPPDADQAQVDAVLNAVADAKIIIEGDRARLGGASAEIKTKIAQAKKNLVAPTVIERTRAVKGQIRALLWPVAIVILIWLVLHSKPLMDLFSLLVAAISKLKIPGGLEIAFASRVVKSTQEEVLRTYRQQVISTYDGVAKQYKIAETLDSIVKGPIEAFFSAAGKTKPADLRCTVHVQDMLFDSSLYQLIDYIGKDSGGSGRAWSVRRGLIGRSWRMEQPQVKGTVTNEANKLIDEWGFTKKEAESPDQRQTMLCYLLKGQNQSPVAMIYLDAKEANAFGNEQQMNNLLTAIGSAVRSFGLDKDLEKLWQEVRSSAPLIEIYADHKK
jgi:hypothetical protein